MSEADILRAQLDVALKGLDSLTTRLAEVTNRMHVLQAQLDDSATRLAEIERERDEAAEKLAIAQPSMEFAEHKATELWRENTALREQLTQAREALEPFANLSLNGDSDHDCPNNCTDVDIIRARQALARIEEA